MKVSETIPMTPQPWNKNPDGYVRHQIQLKRLVEWLEEAGAEVSIPEDRDGWDYGVDLYINGLPVDLKGFGLQAHGESYTWDSEYYRGRPAPIYDETQTEWFVHATDRHPSTWIAGEACTLRTSKYGYAPYYFQHECIDMAEFIRV